MGNFAHVTSYVTRAESTAELVDAVLIAKLKVAHGLAYLSNKKYSLAARKFLEVSSALDSNYNHVRLIIFVSVLLFWPILYLCFF